MKNILTIVLNVFAFGLVCLVIFIALRPTDSASATASPELAESVLANFNKHVSEVLASNQKVQLDTLTEQKKILQKIDANVDRLIDNTSAPSAAEERSNAQIEVMTPTTTSRGIFRRGGIIRTPVTGAGK